MSRLFFAKISDYLLTLVGLYLILYIGWFYTRYIMVKSHEIIWMVVAWLVLGSLFAFTDNSMFLVMLLTMQQFEIVYLAYLLWRRP